MPLKASPKMKELPIFSVKPEGWLKEQIDLTVSGFFGHLHDISDHLTENNGWLQYGKTLDEFRAESGNPDDPYAAFAWEEQAYWLRGAYRLALISGNEELLELSLRYINAMLDSAQDDGWFGPILMKNTETQNDVPLPDIWPHMVMIEVLMDYFDVSDDRRVLDTLLGFCRFCLRIDDSVFMPELSQLTESWYAAIQSSRCCEPVASLCRLYELTGDDAPLRLSERMFAIFSSRSPETDDCHVVNFAQRIKYTATNYPVSGDGALLAECETHYLEHMAVWGQMPGGLYAADERTRRGKHDPRQGSETCAMSEIVRSFLEIGRITGNTLYADRAEDIMFNSYPASHTPDYSGLHYLTCDNQPLLDAEGHDYCNDGMQTRYDPFSYRCCQHNTGNAWPNFLQSLFLTQENALIAWAYAPCRVETVINGGAVTVREITGYPFGESITVELDCEKPITLKLRVPRWADSSTLCVNGEPRAATAKDGFLALSDLCGHNLITVVFPQVIKERFFPLNGNCVCIDRGPLTYSLKLSEEWSAAESRTDRAGRVWHSYDVRTPSPFAYALDLSCPIRVAKMTDDIPPQPFTSENAPVVLHAVGRPVAGWGMGEKNTVMPVPLSPVHGDAPEETILLVPLGCQRVRMSCLPWFRG